MLSREISRTGLAVELVDRNGLAQGERDLQSVCGLISLACRAMRARNESQRGDRLFDVAASHARLQRPIGAVQRRFRISRQQLRLDEAESSIAKMLVALRNPGLARNSKCLLERQACPLCFAALKEDRPARIVEAHSRARRRCIRLSCIDAAFCSGSLSLQLESVAQRQQRVEYDQLVVDRHRSGVDGALT